MPDQSVGEPAPGEPEPTCAVVVLAAGLGSRSGHARNKVLLPLGRTPVFVAGLLTAHEVLRPVMRVVVIREQDRAEVLAGLRAHVPDPESVRLVVGGATRHESEWLAVQALAPAIEAGRIDVVAIHDAARPLASPGVWRAAVHAAAVHGGAIPGHRENGLVYRDHAEDTTETVPAQLVSVQTPQTFQAEVLLEAHRRAHADQFEATDTAGCLARYRPAARVVLVSSDATNVKVTFPEDLAVAQALSQTLNRPR